MASIALQFDDRVASITIDRPCASMAEAQAAVPLLHARLVELFPAVQPGVFMGLTENASRVLHPALYPLEMLARYPAACARVADRAPLCLVRQRSAAAPSCVHELEALRRAEAPAVEAFVASLVQDGFAVLRCDVATRALLDDTVRMADAFFELPMEEKFCCARDEMIEGYGFVARGRETYNMMEAFTAQSSDEDEDVQSVPFPRDALPEFEPHMRAALSCLRALAVDVALAAVCRVLGLDEAAARAVCAPPPEPVEGPSPWRTTLRLLKYYKVLPMQARPSEDDEDELAEWHRTRDLFKCSDGDALCMEHVDSTMLSLAYVSDVPELQILSQSSGCWHDVEAVPDHAGCLVVFPGYYLAQLSGGRIAPTLHRVERKSDRDRLSIPYFLRTEPGVNIPAPAAHPLRADDSVESLIDFIKTEPLWIAFKPTANSG